MVINFIKGIFIGLALVIPGLSASTFAVVMGIYDKLIESLNSIRKDFKNTMKFLMPIGAGAAAGILASAGFLLMVIERFELPSYAFFIGLVLGSVPVIYRKIKPGLPQKWNFGLLLVGLVAIIVLAFIAPESNYEYDAQVPYYMGTFVQGLIIFGAGFIACFLIALPGVSGAMILILIGQFDKIYGAVDNFARSLIGQMDWYYGFNAMLIIAVFFVGAIAGLVIAARIIGALIKRYEASVYFAVMGLVLGAVFVLFNQGVGGNMLHTITYGGGGAIARDTLLALASVALGYLCTGLFGRNKRGVES
ncbi:MAG: DUF368 domain-containing protein [Defluviitaleaceae bacterium]|nr:DUF368 domain-containing protein [Defluviitaleaceae bacterium]